PPEDCDHCPAKHPDSSSFSCYQSKGYVKKQNITIFSHKHVPA
ncbi:unnamed protein product, partial [Allacma fusca]